MSDKRYNPQPDRDNWENAHEKDTRGIPAAWDTAQRVAERVTTAVGNDAAAFAKVAQRAAARLKGRKVKRPVKDSGAVDRRGFPTPVPDEE